MEYLLEILDLYILLIFVTMGFFNKKTDQLNWQQLESIQQVNSIEKKSFERPQLIFKHSTRCSISRIVLKQFENEWTSESGMPELYFLDLLSYRSISNEIAARFNTEHQSPQILLIKNGICIYTASHNEIDATTIPSIVAEYQ